MARTRPPCQDCPRRRKKCHDPKVCPDWKAYLEIKAKEDAAIKAVRDEQKMMDDYAVERGEYIRNSRRKEK